MGLFSDRSRPVRRARPTVRVSHARAHRPVRRILGDHDVDDVVYDARATARLVARRAVHGRLEPVRPRRRAVLRRGRRAYGRPRSRSSSVRSSSRRRRSCSTARASTPCLTSGAGRRRFWVWAPRNLDWAACAVQFAGTLWFNISTGNAVRVNLDAAEADQQVWRPDTLGSIAFLVASVLALMDARRQVVGGRPRPRVWWISVINLPGRWPSACPPSPPSSSLPPTTCGTRSCRTSAPSSARSASSSGRRCCCRRAGAGDRRPGADRGPSGPLIWAGIVPEGGTIPARRRFPPGWCDGRPPWPPDAGTSTSTDHCEQPPPRRSSRRRPRRGGSPQAGNGGGGGPWRLRGIAGRRQEDDQDDRADQWDEGDQQPPPAAVGVVEPPDADRDRRDEHGSGRACR